MSELLSESAEHQIANNLLTELNAKAVAEGLKARHEGQPIPNNTDTQEALKKALEAQSGSL